MAHADGAGHADALEHLGLLLHRIGGCIPFVEGQINQCRGDEFDRGKALVIGARIQKAPQHVRGHRLTGLPVPRMRLKHLGHLKPVFVKLARQFHKVPRNRGARDEAIGHIAQHLVQRMAELVKQRARVVIGQKARLGLGKVADVDDHGSHIPPELFL